MKRTGLFCRTGVGLGVAWVNTICPYGLQTIRLYPLTFTSCILVTDGPLQGNIVLPGETGYYRATVPESISPADDDPPCIAYIYHSYTNMVKDVNTGLVGPVKICKKDSLDEDTGRQVSRI